jgi:carbamoyl-phosphate synthase large subunit
MSTKTLLFLSGGSLVAQFMLTAIGTRRESLRIIATNSIAEDPGLWAFDHVYLTPVTAATPNAFAERVLAIVAKENVDWIVPCRDDDVVALGAVVEQHPELKSRSVGGSVALTRMMSDKWLSYLFARESDLPFADSYHSESSESADAFLARNPYPLIAKPRDGFSSQGVVLIENRKQFDRAVSQHNHVIEEYLGDPDEYWAFKRNMEETGTPLFYTLHGIKHSIELMFDADSRPAAPVFASYNKQKFRSRDIWRNVEAATLAVGQRCYEVFSPLGWRGPLNIQCQLDRNGQVKIHEFNGRYGALAAERALLGFDEVALGIELFTGLRLAATDWAEYPAAVASARFLSSAADPRDVAWLNTHGEWSPGQAR